MGPLWQLPVLSRGDRCGHACGFPHPKALCPLGPTDRAGQLGESTANPSQHTPPLHCIVTCLPICIVMPGKKLCPGR